MGKPRIVVCETEDEVVSSLASGIEAKAKAALADGGKFNVGLSGGSLVKFLCRGLPNIKTDWSKWQFFFCDERLVPVDSPDNTWGLYKSQLVSKLDLSEDQFLVVKTDLEPEAAAQDYQERLMSMLNGSLSNLHLCLLGAGPDGHTCSLFPDHPLMAEPVPTDGGRIVAAIVDSPKPPPARVTLTLPVVNSAGACMFAATGGGKADTMALLLGKLAPSDKPLPARLVNPTNGEVVWYLDKAAAAKLEPTDA